MTRRCILQIGTEKTGTTTLQAFLAQNRDRLARRGILYPRFPGEKNHTGLAAYAMNDGRTDPIRNAFGVHRAAAVPAFRAQIEQQAEAELGASGTVVFCNEHCHSRLKRRAEVQRLAELLMPHFDRIDVSVYLRRQDQVALSLYSTRLKSGNIDTDILPQVGEDDLYFNYDASLALWEEVFGRAHVHVRLFERSELIGGDVVEDFLAAWGLGTAAEYRSAGKRNESIRPEAQDYLRRVNPHIKPLPGLPLDEVLGPLSAQLARQFPGQGARPPRREAEAFYAMFRDSNERVRRRHFAGRERLFDESFDSYPEEGDRTAFGADEVAEIAAQLHMAQIREIRRLGAEIQIREGRLAWQQGEQEVGIARLRQAAATLPDYPDSHRTLAEYLFRAGRFAEAAEAARRAAELRPGRQEYWHFLGIALQSTGDLAGAAAAQERSLEVDPGHEPSRRVLAAIRSTLGAPQTGAV